MGGKNLSLKEAQMIKGYFTDPTMVQSKGALNDPTQQVDMPNFYTVCYMPSAKTAA